MATDIQSLELLRDDLEVEGFSHLKVVPGRGICGLKRFIFTTAIVEGIDALGYSGRWCYPHELEKEAFLGFVIWDGKEDPIGRWIKYKGQRGEYSNPKKQL